MSSKNKKRFGDLMVQEGLITASQLERAVEVQRAQGGKLGDILVSLGLCSEEAVLAALAKRTGLTYLAGLSSRPAPSPALLARLPAEVAWSKNVLPVAQEGNVLSVAVDDPYMDFDTVDELKIQTGCDVRMVLASEAEIRKAVRRYYPERTGPARSAEASGGDTDAAMDTIVNALIDNAAKGNADHIYLEPGQDALHVRYRVKGVLQSRPDVPRAHHAALIARLKVLGRMNEAERWIPQDGRLRRTAGDRVVDVTVSTLPTAWGEKVVIGLSDAARSMPLDLVKLGLEGEVLEIFQRTLESKRGLLVMAGPARSGKSSTLYAALAHLNDPSRHILTVEDPITRSLDGISQMQVRPDSRLTLASGVHVLRRMDPDVLAVSDIRDRETAEAALQAAVESLVLASVTAPDALSAIEQLMGLGISEIHLGQHLLGVLAQRLIRAVCPHCRESHTVSLRQLMSQGAGGREMRAAKRAESFTVYRGRGCGQCLGTGYLGATAVFEIQPVTDAVRRRILEKAGRDAIGRETAELIALREAALAKALAGETTVEEALGLDRRL